MKKLCGNCRHLGKPVGYLDDDGDWHKESGYFECHAIDERNMGKREDGPAAYVHELSGHYVSLRVAEDFGCVLWEGMQNEDAD